MRARRWGGKSTPISAIEAPMISPPANPWMPRAAIRVKISGASAQPAVDSMKTTATAT